MTHHTRQKFRSLLLLVAALCSMSAVSCGSLYKVKPVVDLPPLSEAATRETAGGIVVRVAPLLTDEESQDLFESNLPLAGILPVRIALNYQSGTPIELKKVHVRLHDSEGREWKLISAKQAVSRILSFNGVTLYNPSSRKQFEKEFTAYEIDLKSPLTDADRNREGFLFFRAPAKQSVESPKGLVLQIERLPQPVQVTLN